jgi:glycine hydroxymethyltransferase
LFIGFSNKNTCPGDKSAFRPGGIRLGTSGLTSRGLFCIRGIHMKNEIFLGFKEKDFEKVAEFIHQAIQIYVKYESKAGKTVWQNMCV